MIYLHKILPVFFSPLFMVLALLIAGVLSRRRAWVISGICVLYLLSTPVISKSIFHMLETGARQLTPEELPNADAIVALSGGMSWTETLKGLAHDWQDPDRFLGGVELFLAGKAPILIFTGGKSPWQLGSETEGDVLKKSAKMMQVPENKIWVTDLVENTEQEAAAVKKLLGQARARIILVASAFHMPRAQRLFERTGLEVIAYPVDFSTKAEALTPMSFLPSPGALTAVDTAVREVLGRFYYRLKYFNLSTVE